ncbi:MAG: 2-succinyl-5-enolpyruvyl-6-hydroxy-3-cyclohexene-1-carboxylic-acid synthase [Candidatus Omnitrophica bacterium]|nr:2-succinyl-5-enolpyruvyl-6-hydroxy-3-cyclohexene-1-carboxylic-acid synthase [Candidatus Omnitrophota bacterium]
MVQELLRNGIDTFIVCPGARSSPLALAIADEKRANTFVHVDERGAAFFALGHVSATRRPVAILCTSGTAAANFLPAIIECSKKKLPLLVLTADRPPELRKAGADQTIEQPGLFGEYVRFQDDVPCPTYDIPPEIILTMIDQAVYRAMYPLPGPVHLNCMFREPLVPVDTVDENNEYLAGLAQWVGSNSPYTQYHAPERAVRVQAVEAAAKALNGVENGLILVGKLNSDAERAAVLKLAQKLQWPILPDVTSGLRLSPSKGPVCHYFDQMLASEKFVNMLKVDAVLQLGGRMTSKRLNQLMAAKRPRHFLMVLNHPLRNDPAHQVTLRIEAQAGAFCTAVETLVKARRPGPQLQTILAASRKIGQHLEKLAIVLNEPSVARMVSRYIPSGHGLFLSNSMPIRDMDMYGAPEAKKIMIGANRGASGIDGIMATAMGFAEGAKRPVTLLVGDLAALHDLNSLALLASVRYPVTIVILNNDGGGIFSFLPKAGSAADFERFMATPHGCHFDAAAKMFKIAYVRPKALSEFKGAYQAAVAGKQHALIEVVTERNANAALHADWQTQCRTMADQIIQKG